MDRMIAACGNDCAYCPRYTVHPYEKTAAELRQTAELWMKIGYRDHIVTNEEIACSGCRAENWCRYHVVKCCEEKGIKTCAECQAYPCENLRECFEVTKSFEPMCRRVCSEEEYKQLKKAFFEKEKNLSELACGLKNDADRTDYTGDKKMDRYVDERDSKLLDQDKYTFFVRKALQ